MGLLDFLLRKIGIKRKPEEKQESPDITPFIDCNTFTLEEILSHLPENHIVINQAGEMHAIKTSDIRLMLKNAYELAVAERGMPIDYSNLASIEFRIAESIDNDESAVYYKACLEHLRKGDTTDPNHQTHLTVTLFQVWCNTEDTEEGQTVLQEAYREAQKLSSTKDLDSYQLHYISRIFIDLADSDESLDASQRKALFQRGIDSLQKIADKEGEQCDFYSLGNAQAAFSDHCDDFKEKSDLRKKAIENLKKSYEMDKDPETLEIITDLENEELAN